MASGTVSTKQRKQTKLNNSNPVNDSVQYIAKHLEHSDLPIFTNSKVRDTHITEWLSAYHSVGVSSQTKKYYRDCIILNLWYLFPYVLAKHRFKTNVFDDILQNLVLIVMKAIDKFDTTRGTKFSSYISGYIQNAISSSIRSNMIVRLPAVHRAPLVMYLRRNSPQDDPDPNIDIDTQSDLEEEAPNTQTRCQSINLDSDITLHDIKTDIVKKNLPDGLSEKGTEECLIEKEYLQILRKAVSEEGVLTVKERLVLNFRYGLTSNETKTLDEIAAIFRANGARATKVWIYYIEERAKQKIREYFKTYGVESLQ